METLPPSPCPPNGSENTSTPDIPTSPSPSPPTAPSPSEPSPPPPPPQLSQLILIDLIDTPHPTNGRLEINQDAVRRLRDQIATNGLINPITVRPTGTRFELIAGRNRLHAFTLLGRTEIPATIVQANDLATKRIRLAENVTRSNLSPVEEAAQLSELVEADPNGADGVAASLGRRAEWILDRLEIMSWDTDLQQAVHAKQLSLAAAGRLARIPDPADRAYYVQQAITHGISARTASLWLQDAMGKRPPDEPPSEKSGFPPLSTTPNPILRICFFCGQPEEIQNLKQLYFCPECAQHLHQASLSVGTPRETSPGPQSANPTAPP